ncbi:hypothetical protein IP88_03120 [alpha proteobacterium AAP81b]|nr:hypothetical protein IP88_03120 [alpha proteobacterium AAP81b]
MKAPLRRTGGFALVETLVASVIIALMLVLFLGAANSNARAERLVVDRRQAILVARSALEAASAVGGDAGAAQGGGDGRFRWEVTVTAYDGGAAGTVPLERVGVRVFADDSARPLVTLATLRLAQ